MRLSSSRACALAFLTAFDTLLVQVLVHRMVSAKLLNNFAFLVISLTMLGFALAGVALSRWLPTVLRRFPETVTSASSLFALTLIASSVFFYRVDSGSQLLGTRQDFVLRLINWIPAALLFALPFIACGIVLGALLASPDLSTRRVYCWDLLGSAAGAFAAIPAINYVGVERSTLIACILLIIGGLALFPPRQKKLWAMGLLAVVVSAGAFFSADRLYVVNYPADSMLRQIIDDQERGMDCHIEHLVWDSLSRIEVSRVYPPSPKSTVFPSLFGLDRSFLIRFRRMLTQNNFAFTYAPEYDGNPVSLAGLDDTIYATAYQASSVSSPKVAAIGIGGGMDILTALRFDAAHVTGAEVNRAIVRLLSRGRFKDYFSPWVADPRVDLRNQEGRHFIATSEVAFDILQLSGVDSYSGTPGAAHVFSESYLYTGEAFDLYLQHLTDDGILSMMRLEFPFYPREMLRALVSAVAALRRAGVATPSDHILMVSQYDGRLTSLLVKRTPFTAAEKQRLQRWVEGVVYLTVTGHVGHEPRPVSPYQNFLELNDAEAEAAFVDSYPLNIEPVSDDRPFFFRYSFWRHVVEDDQNLQSAIVPAMEYSVLLLAWVVGLAAMLCVLLPLRLFHRRGLAVEHSARFTLYFAGIGLGYLAVEMAFIQIFGLLLGHPSFALSVVLAALLTTTGLGSLLSSRLLALVRSIRGIALILAAILVMELLFLQHSYNLLVATPFAFKVLAVWLAVLPVGIVLGVFMPHGLDQLKSSATAFVPWAWGINGIFSVLAPIMAIALAISWGSSVLLASAIPVYLLAALSLPSEG